MAIIKNDHYLGNPQLKRAGTKMRVTKHQKEEFKKLQERPQIIKAYLERTINKLCIDVAKYKPTFKGWDGDEESKPWGCGYKEVNNHVTANSHYCDECPVQDICTMDKNWSK